MSQKSVIVVTNLRSAEITNRNSNNMDVQVFATMKDVCDHHVFNYNTLSRKGDCFRHCDYLIQRLSIIRIGGEEKDRMK